MKKRWIFVIMLFLSFNILAEEALSIQPLGVAESSGMVQKVYPVHPVIKEEEAISFRPIGYFRSPYNEKTGAPRQGVLEPKTKATIEIDAIYRPGLADLEKFEHLIVIYWFNKTQTWSPSVNPPQSEHHFGVFSTRSPKRPNPIGFSLVRLEKVDIESGILHLSGIDAFDGTPVLDIKPYLPTIDIIYSPRNIKTERELGHHDEKYIIDSTMYR